VPPTVLIASFLEPELVERIRTAHPAVTVVNRADLIAEPRFPADHNGHPLERSPAQEAEWRALLAQADILYDFDRTHLEDLPALAPRVRWIQATSSGIGPLVGRHRYHERMPDTVITRASGVHAQPLSEFCLMVMLMHSRNFQAMAAGQHAQEWGRFAGSDLEGRTLVVVGLGAIGSQLVRHAAALGLQVIGVGRGDDAARFRDLPLLEYHAVDDLDAVLPRADYLVLVVPHTSETEYLLDRRRIRLLPRGSVVINIGRGVLIDEPALIEALEDGHLGGAGLDVFQEEPLPSTSPLWQMPNVIVSPHSAGTSDRENARLVDLFIENLGRYLTNRPLINLLAADAVVE